MWRVAFGRGLGGGHHAFLGQRAVQVEGGAGHVEFSALGWVQRQQVTGHVGFVVSPFTGALASGHAGRLC